MSGNRETKQETIDWQAVQRCLAETRERLDDDWSADAQETRRILRERAHALARVPTSAPLAGEQIEYLEFTVAQERYGISAAYILEVVSDVTLTIVPCTPAFVAGIINLRGQIVSVIDLERYFGLDEMRTEELSQVIVLNTENMTVGVLAAENAGLKSVAQLELESSLPTLSGRGEKYLKGITRSRIAILDAHLLLSDPDIIVHAEVAA